MTSSPVLQFHDGHSIPQLGLGVYKIPEAAAADAVQVALESGYRHVDTAALYANEAGVGQGIARAGLPRGDVFVTTKVWNADQGYDSTLRAFDESLEKLGLDYVDLYLIHWPAPRQDRYVDTWRALEAIRADGRARSIGVSNFHPHHLDRLLAETDVVPVVNQIELHPWLQQADARAYDAAHGILTEDWSPLARGRAIGDPTLDAIGARYGKSAAQVVIRWHLELGDIVIPKSVTPSRIRENLDVFDFALDAADLAAIATLDSGERTGRDPDDLD
ncbi:MULTISPECIES: aldo/keto reductase [unclassified Cryobacterium]|uniref:aldo/keto reductase n=1 Tax=unclassified Cryobacterium TaxID=2649013 RepID=UPI002AB5A1DB|nr:MULTISPECIES: aldo/keto reductase [unclassified Cryobacterium]MDY7541254.1 aldo/keto reductase [Cryobacterium sp. 5B3]MEB0001138.1 aldo/keto reductase [Cryobacterium sp. RTS3]MEB0267819.1 aldo/keto reductase [Cryobacterium sp. 10I5]MEB0276643.1 aldo/keto reductase [Cryobacterium sp. 5B3]